MATTPTPGDWQKPRHCLRLFLAGDLMTGRAIDQLFQDHNPADFGKPDHVAAEHYLAVSAELHGSEARPVRHDYIRGSILGLLDLTKPDFRLANLETAITRNSNWARKTHNFRMHPANTPCLGAGGFNCCTLANNHVLDFGGSGLKDTLAARDQAGIRHAGAGLDLESAKQPHVDPLADGRRVLVFAWGARDSGIPPSWQAGATKPGVS